MLTQQQILEERRRLGIPDGGFGSDTSGLSERQRLAAEYDKLSQGGQSEPNYLQRVGGQYMNAARDIQGGVQEGANIMSQGGVLNWLRGGLTSALRTVGGVAEATFAPITEAPGVKQGLEAVGSGIQALSETKPIQEVAKITQPLFDILYKYGQENPELAKDLKNVIDVATLGVGQGGVKATEAGLKQVGVKTLEKGTALANTLKSGAIGVEDYAASRIPKLLQIATGENAETIAAALKNPQAADQALKEGTDNALRKAAAEAGEKSIKLKTDFIEAYSQAKNKVLGSYSKVLIPKTNLLGKFNQLLREANVSIKNDELDFGRSKILANPGEIKKITDAYNALRSWDKLTLTGIDEYKQLVGQLTRFADEAGIPSKSPILGRWYNTLNETIYSKLPENVSSQYKGITKKFADNIGLYDDMVDAFNKGDVFARLAGALGKNKDSLRQILEFYEKKSGKSPLSTVAARELSMEKTSSGLLGTGFGFRNLVDFFWSPKKQAEFIIKVGEKLQNKAKQIKIKPIK